MNAVGRCPAGRFSEDDVDGGDVLHFVRSIFLNRMVSHNYGYGLMDAEAMVKLAR